MKSKLALFLFACGLASSSAFAARSACDNQCYTVYNSCKAAGGGRVCETDLNYCLYMCRYTQ